MQRGEEGRWLAHTLNYSRVRRARRVIGQGVAGRSHGLTRSFLSNVDVTTNLSYLILPLIIIPIQFNSQKCLSSSFLSDKIHYILTTIPSSLSLSLSLSLSTPIKNYLQINILHLKVIKSQMQLLKIFIMKNAHKNKGDKIFSVTQSG